MSEIVTALSALGAGIMTGLGALLGVQRYQNRNGRSIESKLDALTDKVDTYHKESIDNTARLTRQFDQLTSRIDRHLENH